MRRVLRVLSLEEMQVNVAREDDLCIENAEDALRLVRPSYKLEHFRVLRPFASSCLA